MQNTHRVTVPLSREEFAALSRSAQQELRPIRDQAHYLLRRLLTDAEKHNGAAQVCETGSGAAVTAFQA